MCAKLVPYEHVPVGFETVIDNADVEMGKTWNLWHNVKLSDDPENWDREIILINETQSRLGKLTLDQRLLRAQMAEFCRVCPVFPRSINVLCEEIGQERFSKPVKIGCEGRGLLDSLGRHDEASMVEQQRETLAEQVGAVEKWLRNGQAETAADQKVFGFLGEPHPGKMASVEKLLRVVGSGGLSVSVFWKLAQDVCRETQRTAVDLARERYRGRPFNCFECLPAESSETKCMCCCSMLLDASILCVGTTGEERSMLGEFRCFVEENVLAYSFALNSWLKQEPPMHAARLENARYVSRESALRIAERVAYSLGRKNEAKEWLVACLLKTVKDNQRWRKRTELIDGFPEAASYFRDVTGQKSA